MKKNHSFFLGFLILLFIGCQKEIDRTNPIKMGYLMHESILKNDSIILNQLFKHKRDSLNKFSLNGLKRAKEFLAVNPDLKILKIDTSSIVNSWSNLHFIDLFYKKGKDFYRMQSTYEADTTGIIAFNRFNFVHLNKLCEEHKNTPYKPRRSIDFNRIMWVTDYSGKTLESGAVEIKNDTDVDINYIKFRVILKNKEDYSSEIFFNQTTESHKTIYKGDMVKIDVPGMEDYYVGFPVKKDNFQWESELIEVRPKPKSFWCQELEKLEAKVIEKA